mgnify:CR=1 FL=1
MFSFISEDVRFLQFFWHLRFSLFARAKVKMRLIFLVPKCRSSNRSTSQFTAFPSYALSFKVSETKRKAMAAKLYRNNKRKENYSKWSNLLHLTVILYFFFLTSVKKWNKIFSSRALEWWLKQGWSKLKIISLEEYALV